jgi:hypothetical protein
MPIADTKKVQSLIQGILLAIVDLESADSLMQIIKTKYQNANPDLTNSNMTTQQVTDTNTMIAAVASVLSDHAAIITVLKSKNIPSHGIKSLD